MSDYQLLRVLNFSQGAIACYESLCLDGSTTAEDLAKRLGRQRTSLYRELKQLEQHGFVHAVKSESQPMYFYATKLDEALKRLDNHYRQVLRPIIISQQPVRIVYKDINGRLGAINLEQLDTLLLSLKTYWDYSNQKTLLHEINTAPTQLVGSQSVLAYEL